MEKVCPVANKHLLKTMFDSNTPNNAILQGVLTAKISGHVYVDIKATPYQAILVSDFLSCAFVSEGCSIDFISQCIKSWHFEEVNFVLSDDSIVQGETDQFEILPRKEFFFDTNRPHIPPITGTYVHPSIKDFELASWKNLFVPSCGEYADFILNHYVIFAMNGEQVISEGYAICGGEFAELGAVTNEAYRKQGIAKNTCLSLLNTCQNAGFQPVWSCNSNNYPSIKTAISLGFFHRQDYYFAVWRKSAVQ